MKTNVSSIHVWKICKTKLVLQEMQSHGQFYREQEREKNNYTECQLLQCEDVKRETENLLVAPRDQE